MFSNTPYTISEWESKGLSNETFGPPFATNKSLSPKLVWYNSRIKVKFKGSCLKQEDEAAFTPKNVDSWLQDLNIEFTLGVAYLEVLN